MEWIFVVFLLGFIPNSNLGLTILTESACYGSNGKCYFVHLECRNETFIHISSAQYLFTRIPDRCKTDTDCQTKQTNGCCDPDNGYHPGTNFSENDRRSLIDKCLFKHSCNVQAPWTMGDSSTNTSSLVEVKFYCKNEKDQKKPEDNTDPDPQSLQDIDSNTAAIVIPTVVVLLAIIVAAVLFIYWRRKKQRQIGKPDRRGNGILHITVQNDGYFKTAKNIRTSKDETDNEYPKNVYHTIDPNSIPDQVVRIEKPEDPGPQDDYHMIDPNKLDYETPVNHDYFVLEPETEGATNALSENCLDTEYNKINLETNDVVKDPNYHRLGSVEQCLGEINENYSHIENGHQDQDHEISIVDSQTIAHQTVQNDDYSHLNQ